MMIANTKADIVENHFSKKNKVQTQPNDDKNILKDYCDDQEDYELEENDDFVADLFIKTATEYPDRKGGDEWRKFLWGLQGDCPLRVLNCEIGKTDFAPSCQRQLAGKCFSFSGCEDAPCGSTGRFTLK